METRWDEIDSYETFDDVSDPVRVERIYPHGEPKTWVSGGTYSVTYSAQDEAGNK